MSRYVIKPQIPCPGILCDSSCRGQHLCHDCKAYPCQCPDLDCLSESEEER